MLMQKKAEADAKLGNRVSKCEGLALTITGAGGKYVSAQRNHNRRIQTLEDDLVSLQRKIQTLEDGRANLEFAQFDDCSNLNCKIRALETAMENLRGDLECHVHDILGACCVQNSIPPLPHSDCDRQAELTNAGPIDVLIETDYPLPHPAAGAEPRGSGSAPARSRPQHLLIDGNGDVRILADGLIIDYWMPQHPCWHGTEPWTAPLPQQGCEHGKPEWFISWFDTDSSRVPVLCQRPRCRIGCALDKQIANTMFLSTGCLAIPAVRRVGQQVVQGDALSQRFVHPVAQWQTWGIFSLLWLSKLQLSNTPLPTPESAG